MPAARRFTNRLANETIELPPDDFTLEFEKGPAHGICEKHNIVN
jgi:hypothetical protein